MSYLSDNQRAMRNKKKKKEQKQENNNVKPDPSLFKAQFQANANSYQEARKLRRVQLRGWK